MTLNGAKRTGELNYRNKIILTNTSKSVIINMDFSPFWEQNTAGRSYENYGSWSLRDV
jgi:hypothetical protein